VPWAEVFCAFLVSHLVGDYLFQTDFQALNKRNGLAGDAVARRALLTHTASYTSAFLPALIWLATDLGWTTVAVAAAIALPHFVQDDGRLVNMWMVRVKHTNPEALPIVRLALDQSFHIVALCVLAVVAGT